MKRSFPAIVAIGTLAGLLITAVPSYALPLGYVYDNGPPVGGVSEATEWIQADDFTFAAETVLSGFRFWTLEQDSQNAFSGSLQYFIYANDVIEDAPDENNILSEGLVSPVQFRFFFAPSATPGYNVYVYNIIVPAVDLAPGTYWLGIHNGPLSSTDRAEWYWLHTTPDAHNSTRTGHEDRAPFDGEWLDNGGEPAFQLIGPVPAPVPEPASLLLAGLGLAGFLHRHSRRRPDLLRGATKSRTS